MFFTAPFSSFSASTRSTGKTVPVPLTAPTAGMGVWYDMADTNSLLGTNGLAVSTNFQPVKTIQDKSGNNNPMTNMDPACASNCVKLSGFGPNSKACVTCGFTNAAYTTYATKGLIGFSCATMPPLFPDNLTMYLVFRSTTPASPPSGTNSWLISKCLAYPGVLFMSVQNAVRYGRNTKEYSLTSTFNTMPPMTTPAIMTLVFNRTTSVATQYINGTMISTWSFTASEMIDSTGYFNLCCNTNANVNYTFAEVGEILCYNAAHDATLLSNNHNYLANKFGIASVAF